jgi:hypothetical protein
VLPLFIPHSRVVRRVVLLTIAAGALVPSLPDVVSARTAKGAGTLTIYVQPSVVAPEQPVAVTVKADSSLRAGSLLWVYVANGSPNTRSGGGCFGNLTLEKAEAFPFAALARGLPLPRSSQVSFTYRTPHGLTTNSFIVCGYIANEASSDPEGVAQLYGSARFRTQTPDATQIPTITGADARGYVRAVLQRKFDPTYAARRGRSDGVRGCVLASRTRATCTVDWSTATYHYYGRVKIWYAQMATHVSWFYSYVIHRIDTRCVSAGKPVASCTKTYIVR